MDCLPLIEIGLQFPLGLEELFVYAANNQMITLTDRFQTYVVPGLTFDYQIPHVKKYAIDGSIGVTMNHSSGEVIACTGVTPYYDQDKLVVDYSHTPQGVLRENLSARQAKRLQLSTKIDFRQHLISEVVYLSRLIGAFEIRAKRGILYWEYKRGLITQEQAERFIDIPLLSYGFQMADNQNLILTL